MNPNFDKFIRATTKPEEVPKVEKILPYRYAPAPNDRDIKTEITELQEQKDSIMDALKEQLRLLDSDEEGLQVVLESEMPNGSHVHFEDGKFSTGKLLEKQNLTLGDIMTDTTWDIDCILDESVPRAIRKEYLVQRAKNKISNLYNKQIIKQEGYRKTDRNLKITKEHVKEYGTEYDNGNKQRAFRDIEATLEGHDNQAGFIAEKMVKSFLRKLLIDNNLGFEIIDVSFDYDMYYKIDFCIRLEKNVRGVGVNKVPDDRGIQFTVNQQASVAEHKLDQIEKAKMGLSKDDHIADIVLISFPQNEIMKAFEKWNNEENKHGGPSKFLPSTIRQELVRKILKGYLSESQLIQAINVAGKN